MHLLQVVPLGEETFLVNAHSHFTELYLLDFLLNLSNQFVDVVLELLSHVVLPRPDQNFLLISSQALEKAPAVSSIQRTRSLADGTC